MTIDKMINPTDFDVKFRSRPGGKNSGKGGRGGRGK